MVNADLEKINKRRYGLEKNNKIYVSGHKGLVGSSMTECLEKNGYKNILKKLIQN